MKTQLTNISIMECKDRRIKELEQELAVVRKDTKRLEWIFAQRFRIDPQCIDDDGLFWTYLKNRYTIDLAMEQNTHKEN